jgi:hypothetical protein
MLAKYHRAELLGQLLDFGGLTRQSFVHAHSLAGRTKLADGQVAGITMDGVLLCWRRLHGCIVDTRGLRGRKRANRGEHGPSWPGLRTVCCSRRLSRGVFTASLCPGSRYYEHLTAAAWPDKRVIRGPLKAWFRGALPRRRRGEGRL